MSKIDPNTYIGRMIGNFTIIEYIGRDKHTIPLFLCKCKCGKEKTYRMNYLSRITNHLGCPLLGSRKHHNLKYEPQEASFRAKYANYKSHAILRNLQFEISVEEAIELMKGNCYYCNSQPNNTYNAVERNRKYKDSYNFYNREDYLIKHNGIDRKNNKLGYLSDNVVSCCFKCNSGKMAQDFDEFKLWVKNIYNNLKLNENE